MKNSKKAARNWQTLLLFFALLSVPVCFMLVTFSRLSTVSLSLWLLEISYIALAISLLLSAKGTRISSMILSFACGLLTAVRFVTSHKGIILEAIPRIFNDEYFTIVYTFVGVLVFIVLALVFLYPQLGSLGAVMAAAYFLSNIIWRVDYFARGLREFAPAMDISLLCRLFLAVALFFYFFDARKRPQK